jgi:hypothetical protein
MALDHIFDVLVVYCKVHLDEGVSSKKMEVIKNSIAWGPNNKDDVVIVFFEWMGCIFQLQLGGIK